MSRKLQLLLLPRVRRYERLLYKQPNLQYGPSKQCRLLRIGCDLYRHHFPGRNRILCLKHLLPISVHIEYVSEQRSLYIGVQCLPAKLCSLYQRSKRGRLIWGNGRGTWGIRRYGRTYFHVTCELQCDEHLQQSELQGLLQSTKLELCYVDWWY